MSRRDGRPAPARTIGRFVADDSPRSGAGRHSRGADLPAQNDDPHYDDRQDDDWHDDSYDDRYDDDRQDDRHDVGSSRDRVRASDHVRFRDDRSRDRDDHSLDWDDQDDRDDHRESSGPARRVRSNQRSGLIVVAAVIAVSAAVSAGLAWHLHLLPHSRPSSVVPLDSAGFAGRTDGTRSALLDGMDPSRRRDGSDDLDREPPSELDPRDQDLGSDPSTDDTPDPSLSDLGDSGSASDSLSGGAATSGTSGSSAGDDLGTDPSYGSAPDTGPLKKQRSRNDDRPDRSRYPDDGPRDYSRDPERSPPALPGVGQDSMPGLGGL